MIQPAAPEDPPRDHMCQTGCGRRAEVMIVRLTDSEVDLQCDTCCLAMWVAIAEQVIDDATQLGGAQSAP
jgi:hypothetical protein